MPVPSWERKMSSDVSPPSLSSGEEELMGALALVTGQRDSEKGDVGSHARARLVWLLGSSFFMIID